MFDGAIGRPASHLPSNIFLILSPFAPGLAIAIACSVCVRRSAGSDRAFSVVLVDENDRFPSLKLVRQPTIDQSTTLPLAKYPQIGLLAPEAPYFEFPREGLS